MTEHRAGTAGDGISLHALGDSALLLRFGDSIDPELSARVLDCAAHLARDCPAWLVDIAPAYASLALFVEPQAGVDAHDPLVEARAWVHARLRDWSSTSASSGARDEISPAIEIQVRYGGLDGPDLDALAQHAGITPQEVIARHCAPCYRVAMLGFAPGFPYLLGLDPSLIMPRLTSPRRDVAAGSVAIGGAQTGIYPRPGPGGWRLIGRTDAVLFDPDRSPPALLRPGDRVRFVPRPAP